MTEKRIHRPLPKRDFVHATRSHQAKISPPTASATGTHTAAAAVMKRVPQPSHSKEKNAYPSEAWKKEHNLKAAILAYQGKPTTKRAKRMARKAFMCGKQTPSGYTLTYHMTLRIDANTEESPELKRQWARWDEAAVKLFRRKYLKLSSQERSKVHEALNAKEEK